MTPEEINMKIAEACGWVWYRIPQKPIHGPRVYRCLFLPAAHEIDQSPEWMVRADGSESICNWQYMQKEGHVQNYYSDLNACAEMEKTLDNGPVDIQSLYYDYLSLAAGWKSKTLEDAKWESTWNTHRATAPQRCEAFLKTKGLWVEQPAAAQPPNPVTK